MEMHEKFGRDSFVFTVKLKTKFLKSEHVLTFFIWAVDRKSIRFAQSSDVI